MNEYLTPQEVADIFKVSRATVYKWIEQNKIDSIQIGGTIRIPAHAIEGGAK